MLNVYGCPMHYGVNDNGLIYSLDFLNQYYDLQIPIVPEITVPEKAPANLKHLKSITATCYSIAKYQYSIHRFGDIPLFIGGDHSTAIGLISGSSARFEDLGLIWINSHANIHTDQTTETGNIHEMSVAALLGIGEKSLTSVLTAQPKLKPENIVMLGLRRIDSAELFTLQKLGINYYTYEEICRIGLNNCIRQAIVYLSRLHAVHLSFDLTAMDPKLMPGVSVPEPDGFDVSDIRTLFVEFMDHLPIVSIDIADFNMAHDINCRTSDFVNTLIRHLMDRDQKRSVS